MNPEFRRQLWLELNASRLVLLAISLGALFALMGLIDAQFGLGHALPTAAMVTFIGVTVAWGGQCAGESIFDELRAHTWDLQRISALAPWTLTWGKLFGATSYQWLAGLACLIVYAVTSPLAPAALFARVLQALGGAVFVHALSMIGAFAVAGRGLPGGAPLGTKWLGIALGLAYGWGAFHLDERLAITWFGHAYPALVFATTLMVFASAWAVLGAYRMMCVELQVATIPVAWSGLIGFVTLVGAGLMVQSAESQLDLARWCATIGFACALAGAYLAAFTLHRDPLAFYRISRHGRAHHWRALAQESPLWLWSIVLAGGLALLSAALGPMSFAAAAWTGLQGAAVPMVLYAIRDLLILLGASFGLRPARAEVTTMIYLGLLYWLVPAVLNRMGLASLAALVRPTDLAHPLAAILPLGVQIALAATLSINAYRARIAPRPVN